jgi:hypothetical protein
LPSRTYHHATGAPLRLGSLMTTSAGTGIQSAFGGLKTGPVDAVSDILFRVGPVGFVATQDAGLRRFLRSEPLADFGRNAVVLAIVSRERLFGERAYTLPPPFPWRLTQGPPNQPGDDTVPERTGYVCHWPGIFMPGVSLPGSAPIARTSYSTFTVPALSNTRCPSTSRELRTWVPHPRTH